MHNWWAHVHSEHFRGFERNGNEERQETAHAGGDGMVLMPEADDSDSEWETERSEDDEDDSDSDFEAADDEMEVDWDEDDEDPDGHFFGSDSDEDFDNCGPRSNNLPDFLLSAFANETRSSLFEIQASVRGVVNICEDFTSRLGGFSDVKLLEMFSYANSANEMGDSIESRIAVIKSGIDGMAAFCNALMDALAEASTLRQYNSILNLKDVIPSNIAFGGILPRHPMFFSGWKGNPFLMAKRSLHWMEQETFHTFIRQQRTQQFIANAYEWFQCAENIKRNFGTRLVDIMTEPVMHTFAEIMTITCACFSVQRDWWNDWHTSTTIGIENMAGGNILGEIDGFMADTSLFSLLDKSESLEFVHTGIGNPYQWAYSYSDANHDQCAKYMTLGEMEEVNYFPLESAKSASFGSTPSSSVNDTLKLNLQRPWTIVGQHLFRAGQNRVCDVRNASQRQELDLLGICYSPDVFPFTRYLPRNEDNLVFPKKEDAMSLPADVISMDMAFGFLAIGFDNGVVAAFCLESSKKPKLILYCVAQSPEDMYNSVHLSRRVTRNAKDEPEFEFSLLATRNTGFIDLYILSKHSAAESDLYLGDDFRKILSANHKFISDGAFVMGPMEASPNDAKISPDGRYLAAVGDSGFAWISSIRYAKGVDSDFETTEEFDSTLPKREFGKFLKVSIPNSIFESGSGMLPEQRLGTLRDLSMQYMSWSSDSRWIAASTDFSPWILIFNASNEPKLVFRIAGSAPTFAVSFHPHKPNILAFSNRSGTVHLVDISAQISDNNLLGGSDAPVVYPPRQILKHDYKVPIEPRSGSYPDLTALHGSTTTAASSLMVQNDKRSHQGLQESFHTVAAKINGIQWSDDGNYLYVATNRRILMHSVIEKSAPKCGEIVARAVVMNPEKFLDETGDAESVEMLKHYSRDIVSRENWVHHNWWTDLP